METRVWLKQYDDGVPHTLQPYPARTLIDLVSDTARQRPGHPALIFQGARLSYGQLERLSDAFAAALVALGVKKGDRVALMLPNCPQFVIGQLGAWKAGAIVVPTSPLYAEPEVRRALTDCGAETALVLTPFYAKVKAAQPGTPLRRIIATNVKEYLPPHLRLLFSLFKEKREGHRITLEAGDLWLHNLLKRHKGAASTRRRLAQDDTALLICTGGTTGTPKAAMGSHQALLMTAMQIHTWFASAFNDWDDVAMGNMPMFHAFGQAVMAAAMVGHNPVALLPDPRDLDNLLDTIRARARCPPARGACTVHQAAQSSPGSSGQGRSAVDQALFLGRSAAHGRDKEPLRSRNGRPDRGGLLPDRGDGGHGRHTGQGGIQTGLGGRACARRRDPHCGRRQWPRRPAGGPGG